MIILYIYLLIAAGCFLTFYLTGLPSDGSGLYWWFSIGDMLMCLLILLICSLFWPITVLWLVCNTEV